MSSIKDYLTEEHRHCDKQFAEAEQAIAGGDWETGESEFTDFREQIERHFEIEENVLFPEFENATGMMDGPTAVMRWEHEQMRHLFEQMALALQDRRDDEYLDAGETLLIMMQQHNMKEEQMLYDMADRQFGDHAIDVLARMQEFH